MATPTQPQSVNYDALAQQAGAVGSTPLPNQTPNPNGSGNFDYDALAQKAGAVGSSVQSTETVQPNTNSTQDEQVNSAAKHGLLHRAWDWINTPVFDNILPKDIKTSDIIKAAAFEKMYGEAFIPGVNDFDSKAQVHLGDSPTKAAVRTFINGTANDTAKTVSSLTSPVGIALTASGVPELEAGSTAAKGALAARTLAGTAFGLQGVHDIYDAGTENTPEAWQQRLQGAAMAAGGVASLGEGASAVRTSVADNLARRVSPVTKTIAGQDVPVRVDTRMGRFAAKAVDPEVVAKAAEKTAGAVQEGVGEVAKEAAGSNADTSVKGEDRFGLRGHANDLIENQARPVFKALDELSGNKFSEAQRAEKMARRIGDFDALNEAVTKQDELTEQFRDELNDRGLDPDEAWGNYRKGVALQKIASQFDTATGPKDAGLGYQVKGDRLAAAIDRIRRSAPDRNLFKRAGFTDSHIDGLAELADTLRNEQNIPEFKGYQRFAAKAIAGAVGFGHSGVAGLAEALTGESVAESLLRKGATSVLGQAMMSEPATRELTGAMKSSDPGQGAAAVQGMAKADPTWWAGLKNNLVRLWQDEHGSAGAPGTVGGDTEKEELAPTFFSKAEQVANQKVSTGSGDSILAALRNNGVKESEIQWLGLDDYLKGKPKVSKADLQQYINEHKIALNEVNLGGDRSGLISLRSQRDKVLAENNRIWADHLRYAGETTALFNAMQDGQDVDPIIAKLPANVQEPARRFVDTDKQLHDIDDKMTAAYRTTNKEPRYGQYTLPGEKQSYTEKLLTLPDEGNLSDLREQLAKADEERTQYLQTSRPVPGDVELRFQDAQKAVRQAENKSTAFKSSHFDEPNVLAHTRFDDRMSLDGEKTLFLEELQSDWHQKGKKEGYQNAAPTKLPDGIFISPEDGKFQVVNREGNPLLSRLFGSEQEAKTAALTHYGEGAGNPGVPNAPFKSDWHELVIKRMLRHAAENGYDRLAWTTGDQQAARYDLSKHIGRVTYDPTDNTLQAFDPNGKNVLIETVDPKASAISEYIGKEPAQKLMEKVDAYKPAIEGEDEPDIPELKGLDLKVGGDWAKALYDRAIPNFLNKYTKKWGAKVGETEVSTTNSGSLRYEILDPKGNVYDAFRNKAGAEDAVRGYQEAHRGPGKWTVRDNSTTEKVHSIDITPQMRKSVLTEGQPIARVDEPQTEYASG